MTAVHAAARTALAAVLATAAACGPAGAAGETTLEAVLVQSRLSAGLPDGTALNLRGTRLLGGDDLVRGEVLAERRFGAEGGIVGIGGQRGLAADTFVAFNAAAGHGGPNWANRRFDLGVHTRLGAARDNIVGAAVYHAAYDQGRSDRGVNLGWVGWQFAPVVLQAGVIVNESSPGRVRSAMFNAAVSWGQDGRQLFVVRGAHGNESYQALGDERAIADFRSSLLAVSARRWLGPGWGLAAQAEHYRNPTYRRLSLSASAFAQF